MTGLGFELSKFLLRSIPLVHRPQTLIHGPIARGRKGAVLGRIHNVQRPRRNQRPDGRQIELISVPEVDAVAVLFHHIMGDVRTHTPRSMHRRCHLKAIVRRRRIPRHRATARPARDRGFRRVNLLPRFQIIQCTDGVPHFHTRRRVAKR